MANHTQRWEQVDLSKLDEETRYRLLQYVVNKYGKKRVYEEIGISRVDRLFLPCRSFKVSVGLQVFIDLLK